jgi:quaternary ammonium compound-resistance protein SugE
LAGGIKVGHINSKLKNTNKHLAWIYIIIAALFEAAWTYSVKFLKFSDFKNLTWGNFYNTPGLIILWPLVGYLAFGLFNAYFFSLAIKQIPTAMAFAAWTGASIIVLKLSDTLFFHEAVSWGEIFFMLLIMTGIMGLKFFTV